MFERPHGKARKLEQASPDWNHGHRLQDDPIFDTNGETKPVEIEFDTDGTMLLPAMQGEGLEELPSLESNET